MKNWLPAREVLACGLPTDFSRMRGLRYIWVVVKIRVPFWVP